jgi:hypothetical protein
MMNFPKSFDDFSMYPNKAEKDCASSQGIAMILMQILAGF